MDLAREQQIGVEEADIDLYDTLNAEEVFITSTSYCICPVGSVNGVIHRLIWGEKPTFSIPSFPTWL